ncbi:MAG: hypothetical protein AAGF83_20760 [Cyanobacteria bacterium P01_G01_bin.67]
MTTKEFNTHIDAIESIINEKLIPLIANVFKAIVTLICLAIKAATFVLNYIYKITGGESADAAKEFAKNIRENNTLQCDDGTKSLMIPASINEAMGFKFSNHHSLNNYIREKLKPELTTNLINMSSYKAPKNRRCKKHHICINNRCVPTEIAALVPSI